FRVSWGAAPGGRHRRKTVSADTEKETDSYHIKTGRIKTPKNAGMIKVKGIAIQDLSANALHSLIVPLPPLAE
ncbi:MAG: hypothetical protein ACFNW0_06815, partial [Fretibacterium sp.]